MACAVREDQRRGVRGRRADGREDIGGSVRRTPAGTAAEPPPACLPIENPSPTRLAAGSSSYSRAATRPVRAA